MKKPLERILLLLISFSTFCQVSCNIPLDNIQLSITEFPVSSSVRAIAAIDDQHLWYAGTQGQFGYTEDGGKSWYIDSLQFGDKPLEFRSIVWVDEVVYLMGVKSPALIFRSTDKGQNWEMVYREDHPDTYYNTLAFWDKKDGLAVGDPTDTCISIIITDDGGDSWEKVSCEIIPDFIEGEAGFAASGTNIALAKDRAWLATGGAASRLFHTPDRGKSWEVFDTPINEGGKMTGIYSVSFRNEQHGIIFGGDWQDKEKNTQNKAITQDGGRSWQLINDGANPSFRSCVQYVPHTDGREIFAIGIPGISYSNDGSKSWQKLSEESYYTIRIVEGKNVAWLAGRGKVARMTW